MLFAEVVAASAAVGATRSRTAKAAALAALLRAATPDEVEPATAWLAGRAAAGPHRHRLAHALRHRRAARGRAHRSPSRPSTPRSTRSPPPRAPAPPRGGPSCCAACSAPPPREEQRFLRRLLTGELRQGALEGVMLEAVARPPRSRPPRCGGPSCCPGASPRPPALALDGGEPALDGRHACRSAGPSGRCWPPPPIRSTRRSPSSGPDVSVEYKLDGARIQVHRDGDDVRVWTRTLREITAGVPELVELVRGAARAARWCSTARPSRCATTAAPARSRRR